LTYAEGDVRVERSDTKDAGWQMAATGLPFNWDLSQRADAVLCDNNQ
jgi:hypothetical protein